MTRMFTIPTPLGLRPMRTWNVFVGCRFNCTYCVARKTAETRLKHIPRYRDGFTPKFIESEMSKTFKPGEYVFVSFMGDIAFATADEMNRTLDRIDLFPATNFLFMSKRPQFFCPWDGMFAPNIILGTTIESNIDYALTNAPSAASRYIWLRDLKHPRKFVSIEPIMDFDLRTMVGWMKRIKPEIIEIGADNYRCGLPEPAWGKVEELLSELRRFCPTVIEKRGLERLKRSVKGKED